ncbi:hypothetical protein GCM10008022_03090 [Paenibacillus hunanensis]|uniref:Uncharacterized protein n=1 Tax=Paenibacillus hunanensis TaxID=539262 RepID=A0ABU1IW23_9BACL|nr:hypothetical protein [Paenibacillus hunanensis]GGI97772.1 hypothetical protein GCM10008022_03090 [Paenibacillus hunanensis]
MNTVINALPILMIIFNILFLLYALNKFYDSSFHRNIIKIVIGAALIIVNVVVLFK